MTIETPQSRLNPTGKGGIQTIRRHMDSSLMSGLPCENVIKQISFEQFFTFFAEKESNFLQMCVCDVDDDMPPRPQINLDSQSFEGFLLQNLGQFHARPIFIGRFVGTKDITTI